MARVQADMSKPSGAMVRVAAMAKWVVMDMERRILTGIGRGEKIAALQQPEHRNRRCQGDHRRPVHPKAGRACFPPYLVSRQLLPFSLSRRAERGLSARRRST